MGGPEQEAGKEGLGDATRRGGAGRKDELSVGFHDAGAGSQRLVVGRVKCLLEEETGKIRGGLGEDYKRRPIERSIERENAFLQKVRVAPGRVPVAVSPPLLRHVSTTEHHAVSIIAIARRAGVAKSTVSLALRDNPLISEKQRKRIQKIATKMGWQPRPHLARLMSELSSVRKARYKATLAFVSAAVSDPRQVLPSGTAADWLSGAETRARQLGYGLDRFWLNDRRSPMNGWRRFSGRAMCRASCCTRSTAPRGCSCGNRTRSGSSFRLS